MSFIIVETTSKETDFLTGAHTRKISEDMIRHYINKNKDFTVIMIDLDDFKIINDTYGHNEGDKALVAMCRVLFKVFDKDDVISRFGGDEFIIVTKTTEEKIIKTYRSKIYKLLKKSKDKHIKELKFSYGYAYCIEKNGYNVEKIIIEADNNMYLDKANNKSNNKKIEGIMR